MSHDNPTPLRVGAQGALNGWRVRIAGRVVMGMQAADGETYYWNEFNLVDGFGRSATLVFEAGEDGPEWKLFNSFEPLRPLTAGEAATKGVGDTVNLDGTPRRITLVDRSRVHHIEGTAPEGVEVGDIANYFNIDTGELMLVASWTGAEIEFYEGHDLPPARVAEAFGLPRGVLASSASRRPEPGESAGAPLVTKLVGIAFAAIMFFSIFSCGGREKRVTAPSAAPLAKQVAPALRLANGAQGTLARHTYTVASHAVIAVARVGRRHDRHEYALVSDTREPALLIQGLNGGLKEWHLLQPAVHPSALATLTPFEAAARRKGAPVPLDGRTLRITDLFQSTVLSTDGVGASAVWPALQYGFVAHEAGEWLIARWTETGIRYHHGRAVPESEVFAALGPGPEKAR